jgi:methyl-accepting chemotaxis protein
MNHEEIIKEQDEQLNEIESSVKRIKQNAKLINQTIDDQKVYIQEMNDGMDQTQKKMGTAMKKIGEFLQTQNQSQIKLFLSLLCVAIIMFFILLIF